MRTKMHHKVHVISSINKKSEIKAQTMSDAIESTGEASELSEHDRLVREYAARIDLTEARFKPPYAGPDAPEGKLLMIEDALNDYIHHTFNYYDTDDSGTLNTYHEMRQLTVNLGTTLVGARIKTADIEAALRYFKDPFLDRHPLSLPTYAVWFARNVCYWDASPILTSLLSDSGSVL